MYFVGEGAVDKALQLDGSDVGGWTVSVEAFPFRTYIDSSGAAIISVAVPGGYSLDYWDLESAVRKHFSSCGEITKVEFFWMGQAEVHIVGEDAADKAMELSRVMDVGGCKLVAEFDSLSAKYTVHKRPNCRRRSGKRAAESTAE